MANSLSFSRSPTYQSFVDTSATIWDFAECELVTYKGSPSAQTDIRNFTFKKPIIDGRVSFDLSQITYDLIKYNTYYQVIKNEPVYYQSTIYYTDNVGNRTLKATTTPRLMLQGYNGYRYFFNGSYVIYSPQSLYNSNEYYWDGRLPIRIPVFRDNSVSINVDYTYDGNHVNYNITPSDNTSDVIQDIVINPTSSFPFIPFTEEFEIVILVVGQYSHHILVKPLPLDYCKYPDYTAWAIDFVAKDGAINRIHCGGRSITSIEYSRETYNANTKLPAPYVIDPYTVYNWEGHKYKNFNVNGRKSLQVNTGYVGEYMYILIEQLMLSEQVWLVDYGERMYPANVKSSSYQMKNKVDDKLINYTIDLEFSFDEVVVR